MTAQQINVDVPDAELVCCLQTREVERPLLQEIRRGAGHCGRPPNSAPASQKHKHNHRQHGLIFGLLVSSAHTPDCWRQSALVCSAMINFDFHLSPCHMNRRLHLPTMTKRIPKNFKIYLKKYSKYCLFTCCFLLNVTLFQTRSGKCVSWLAGP